ncbi:MAG: fibronectin type III domain-containing protein [Ignavibacteria bacterium]
MKNLIIKSALAVLVTAITIVLSLSSGFADRAGYKHTSSINGVSDFVNFEANFYQMDYVYFDSAQINSDWGSIELIFDDFEGMKILNLSVIAPGVDSVWQIRNVPVISTSSIRDTQYFSFDIGTVGIDVNSIFYGISLTDSVMPVPPPVFQYSFVSPLQEVHTDQINATGPVSQRSFFIPAIPFIGIGKISDIIAVAKNKDFPKKKPGFINGSVESAISNSLHYLDTTHVLFLNKDVISPDTLHKYLTDNTHKIAPNWVERKDALMKKADLGITTRFLKDEDVEKLVDQIMLIELRDSQDVEMVTMKPNGKYEVSPVTAIKKYEKVYNSSGGTQYKPVYDITINIDSRPMIVDPNSNDIKPNTKKFLVKKNTVPDFVDYNKFETTGDSLVGFVVECPGPDQWDDSPVNPSNASYDVPPYPLMISWNPHPTEDSYWLEVATDFDFNNKVVDSTHLDHPYMNTQPNTLMPNTTYFWRVRANDSVGPGKYNFIYNFTTASAQRLNLKAIMQGFYNATTNKMIPDTAKVFLRNNFPPFALVDSSKGVLDSNNSGVFNFYDALPGTGYFLVFRHRNSIETWSKNPAVFTAGILNYDFTNSPIKAFGNNMTLVDTSPLRFGIYSGDVDQEGHVNLPDILLVFQKAISFTTGYYVTDLNGDNITDLRDVLLAYNNASNFVGVVRP